MTNVKGVPVRPCVHADLDSVVEIERACFLEDPWMREEFEDLLRVGARAVVAEFDRELVGFIFCINEGDSLHVLDVAVCARARRRGWGRVLMEDAFSFAQSSTLASVVLEVGVGNELALQLYQSMGFEVVGRMPRYYLGGGDAFAMKASVSS